MQYNRVLNKEHWAFPYMYLVSSVGTCACTKIPCAPDRRHVCGLCRDGVFNKHCFCLGTHLQAFLSPFPPSLHCRFSVMGACLLAGLPGFASHGSSLHLGAGCQEWKLLAISGTRPPCSDAVVKYGLLTKCEVKMAGCWSSSFSGCLWTEKESRSINTQKKRRPISTILSEQTWSIKEDCLILPTRVDSSLVFVIWLTGNRFMNPIPLNWHKLSPLLSIQHAGSWFAWDL